jgi:hypothetical protein
MEALNFTPDLSSTDQGANAVDLMNSESAAHGQCQGPAKGKQPRDVRAVVK